jgi:ribosomal protein L19E
VLRARREATARLPLRRSDCDGARNGEHIARNSKDKAWDNKVRDLQGA